VDHRLLLIVLMPLAGFLLNGTLATAFGGRRVDRRVVTAIGCGLPMVSFAIALWCFAGLQAGGAPLAETVYTWARIGGRAFDVSLYLDRLAAVMVLIVTGVGSLIHVYSVGYMKDDPGYGRYFAYLNVFLFFMLVLVLGRSLLVLFVGWEGVGLASYLLIGFWFDDMDKARAGKKAFITNRIGDAGFLIGMFVLYQAVGTLDMDAIDAAFAGGGVPVSASLVGILLFVGATGKSAQIPLHVWLPDAMAGPTPVSALIHAATMVTAGVYMTARLSGVYAHAPEASQLIAAIGAATAFFAASVALVQTDIKKVLAYSTISQLGFMFVAIGVGAYGVAIFHLYTHAFFKACLFLGAGSVIHALGGAQDITRMGGLARRIPVTFVTFAIATAAIAGLPPLAGFFSKDEILWFAMASERGGSVPLFAVAALTALLTALYMFRLLWLTFLGAPRMDADVARHVHESPPTMTGVLAVLAILSSIGGFVAIPRYLEPLLPLPPVQPALEHLEAAVMIGSVGLALAGLVGAWYFFREGGTRGSAVGARFGRLRRLLAGKYFVDEAYDALVGRPLLWISQRVFLEFGDRRLLDGSLDGLASLARRSSGALGRVQTGSLQRYALIALLGIVATLAWTWRHA